MKITIVDCPDNEEEEIIIRCKEVDDHILGLVRAIKAEHGKLTVFAGEKLFQVTTKDVYYFESVDNKVFAYMEKDVYEVKLKLYELEEMLTNTDFFRASKSTIINLSQINNLSPEFNGRFTANLKNGEKALITRQCVPDLKRKLGLKG